MGIEKKAALVCVVVLAILFGIGLSNREERPVEKSQASKRSRAVAQEMLKNIGLDSSDEDGEADEEPNDTDDDVTDDDDDEEPQVDEETPGFRIVTVQYRDNFSRIAKRELGNANLYPVLVKANPDINPRNMREGQEVRIPVDRDGTSKKKNNRRQPKKADVADRKSPGTYRVKRHETLSAIARSHYGRASKWRTIFAANRSQLRRPESLREGMVIRIP